MVVSMAVICQIVPRSSIALNNMSTDSFIPIFFENLIIYYLLTTYLLCVCVHAHVHLCALALTPIYLPIYACMPAGTLQELILSFYYVGPRD